MLKKILAGAVLMSALSAGAAQDAYIAAAHRHALQSAGKREASGQHGIEAYIVRASLAKKAEAIFYDQRIRSDRGERKGINLFLEYRINGAELGIEIYDRDADGLNHDDTFGIKYARGDLDIDIYFDYMDGERNTTVMIQTARASAEGDMSDVPALFRPIVDNGSLGKMADAIYRNAAQQMSYGRAPTISLQPLMQYFMEHERELRSNVDDPSPFKMIRLLNSCRTYAAQFDKVAERITK